MLQRIDELQQETQRNIQEGIEQAEVRREESVRGVSSAFRLICKQRELDHSRAAVTQLRLLFASKKKDFDDLRMLHTEAITDLKESETELERARKAYEELRAQHSRQIQEAVTERSIHRSHVGELVCELTTRQFW